MTITVKPLELAELVDNYAQCTFGNTEPTHLRIHPQLFTHLMAQVLIGPQDKLKVVECSFYNARIVIAEDMGGVYVHFCTITRLSEPRYNCWRDEKGTWKMGSAYPVAFIRKIEPSL